MNGTLARAQPIKNNAIIRCILAATGCAACRNHFNWSAGPFVHYAHQYVRAAARTLAHFLEGTMLCHASSLKYLHVHVQMKDGEGISTCEDDVRGKSTSQLRACIC